MEKRKKVYKRISKVKKIEKKAISLTQLRIQTLINQKISYEKEYVDVTRKGSPKVPKKRTEEEVTSKRLTFSELKISIPLLSNEDLRVLTINSPAETRGLIFSFLSPRRSVIIDQEVNLKPHSSKVKYINVLEKIKKITSKDSLY